MDDNNLYLTAIDNRPSLDLLTQTETIVLLINDIPLLGFYLALLFFRQQGLLNFVKQNELAQKMDLSWPTFSAYKNKLKDLGLISITDKNRTQIIAFNEVKRLSKIDVTKDLSKLQSKVVVVAPKPILKPTVLPKVISTKSYPNEDYISVTNAYIKYKGLGLQGNDLARARGAVKKMFESGHTVKEIIDCIKFFTIESRKEEKKWMRSWTLETIGKKMPEFKAGLLKDRTMDDDYPELQ